MVETSEREMVRKTDEEKARRERFTSLQPTYEDTVTPDAEKDWDYED